METLVLGSLICLSFLSFFLLLSFSLSSFPSPFPLPFPLLSSVFMSRFNHFFCEAMRTYVLTTALEAMLVLWFKCESEPHSILSQHDVETIRLSSLDGDGLSRVTRRAAGYYGTSVWPFSILEYLLFHILPYSLELWQDYFHFSSKLHRELLG